ncbi:MAG: radical SAM protein [Bdellovibrionota bacterium]
MEIQTSSTHTVEGLYDPTENLLNRLFPARQINKVLLVNPPDATSELFQISTAKRRRYTNYPPYGLAVIATHLRSIGVKVQILNLNHLVIKTAVESPQDQFQFDETWQSKIRQTIEEFKPDMVGVTCMFTMTHTSLKRVCDTISEFNVPISIGGVHISNDVNRILKDVRSASIAFLREGDNAIQNFVNVVNRKAPLSDLTQVILVDQDAYYRFDGNAQPTAEQLNFVPSHDLVENLNEYSEYGTVGAFYWLRPKGTRFATVLSNRGCRARCTFCSVRNFNGDGVRQRSVSSVVDELERLRDNYGIRHVMWLDDDLLMNHERAISLFNEMVKRNLGMTWDATNGVIAFSCTDEVISAAEASGCVAVNIGMESGNAKILKEVRKPGKVETFLKAAEVLKKHEKIHASVLLMVGFPGETLSMALDTIQVARQMDLDWYRISPLQPLPNTPIYDSMVAQGLLKEIDPSKTVFQGGAYGRQIDIEQGRAFASPDFREAFGKIPLDAVPSRDQITDIWFYMNYHLNFHRLFHEERPIKIQQQMANLKNLSDVIAPENGFALYFLGVLEYRVHGRIDPALIERLEKRIESSLYWKDRLAAFGLKVDDLKALKFESAQRIHL